MLRQFLKDFLAVPFLPSPFGVRGVWLLAVVSQSSVQVAAGNRGREFVPAPPSVRSKGQKKHTNFFNINFLHPTQNLTFGDPTKEFMYLIPWERTQN